MDTISTRSLAEHLTMLATMLDADALRLGALGVETRRDLAQEAAALKVLAERLWQTAGEVPLVSIEPRWELRAGCDRRAARGELSHRARLSTKGDNASIPPEAHAQYYQVVGRG